MGVEIVKIPATGLKKTAQPVDPAHVVAGAYLTLFEQMKTAMRQNSGVGLAANQIGRPESIFVIDETIAKEHGVPTVYLNPEITEYSRDTDELEEGCLSIPDYYFPILRSKKVKLKALDEHGQKIKLRARGFLARIFQHETDHLNGLVIKDRAQMALNKK